jgi:serine phosphatase RsbU (regulator of sigma subunit)
MSAARLEITDAQGWRVVPIETDLFEIGRRTGNHLRISGSDISRDHARIVRDNDQFVVQDRGSAHGTFVNGERITEHVLAHGDRIQLGQSGAAELVFLLEAADARNRPAGASELHQIAALLEKLRALGSGRVLDEVLALVLDSAIELTGADRGFIMLAADGRLEFTLARARGRVTLPGDSFDTSRKIPEAVFASGRQMVVEDLFSDTLAPLHTGTVALGIRHVLCTPLRLVHYVDRPLEPGERDVIGVLYLDSHDRGVVKSASALAALDALSAEAGLAIENARLYREALEKTAYEQELKVAAAFQQALLPPAERSGTFFTAAAISLPSRSIGGDFFDYAEMEGQFGFVLGDVTGKGAAAALLAAAALGMFTVESARGSAPAALLAQLNRDLLKRLVEMRLVTTFYGVLAPDGSFTYSNAGHNPPVVIGRAGIRRLDVGGVPLGLFEDSVYEEATVSLQAGDLVVAFSDGVTEARNRADEEFSDERLMTLMAGLRGSSPRAAIDATLSAVRTFSAGVPQGDDVTVVALRYAG